MQRQFEEELDEIKRTILSMAGLVEKCLEDVTVALADHDIDIAEAVIAISNAKVKADDPTGIYWSYRKEKLPKVSKALAEEFFDRWPNLFVWRRPLAGSVWPMTSPVSPTSSRAAMAA